MVQAVGCDIVVTRDELRTGGAKQDLIQGYAKDFHEMCEIFLWNSLAFIPFVEVFSWAVKNAFTLHKYRVEVFS